MDNAAIYAKLVELLVSGGPTGIAALVFFKLWRDSEERRETERKDNGDKLFALQEKRIEEGRQGYIALTESKQAFEKLTDVVSRLIGKA